FQQYKDEYSDFTQGWAFLSRKKDISDFEWQTMKLVIKKVYIWVILSTVMSELMRKFKFIKSLQWWQVIITVTFVINELGVFPLVVILFQPLVFTVAYTWRSKFVIWLCNGIALLLISVCKHYSAGEEFLIIFKLTDKETYITILAIFWMNLRCVSYYLDLLDVPEREQRLMNFLSYSLYLPTAFSGPFIPYKDFKRCQQFDENLSSRLYTLLFEILRFLFWLFFAEFCLHFIYVNATSFHPEWVKSLDSWSLYGYGYTMGQFFHIKYLVFYGLATSFAKFENVIVPSLPVCIGRIHLYSDMWKYFDAGLYNFLLSKLVQNRFLSSLICFIFVYIWHGTDGFILIWTVLNYIAIIIENIAAAINENHLQNSKLIHKLGPKWFRRISCIAASPLLAVSAVSNFYFFARSEIGNIFALRFLN
ncbi:protein-cysteine N-palmitoyltransferase Rasp, partial [Asbolus verrucosus]